MGVLASPDNGDGGGYEVSVGREIPEKIARKAIDKINAVRLRSSGKGFTMSQDLDEQFIQAVYTVTEDYLRGLIVLGCPRSHCNEMIYPFSMPSR